MVKCGSKGSDLNIAQMIALLGQQSIEGKRIAYGFQDRTLPHFKRYDDGADARGVNRLLLGEAVVDQEDEAGAAVKTLELDDLGEGLVELGGFEVLLQRRDGVVGVGVGVAAEGDGGAVAEDLVGDAVDVAPWDAVTV